ncbi:LOW QUALITY PROTEIN: uncharacterized protein LOC116923801 [Daphnia magna]|uniref:LOW QUALITY PROTEIN: uncharacterized protein LOC116923801 n=1 Tax=Daphnia magna TaxID=35525 RepID=UPI001E1BBB88|nr:LOW QUALITY PROTEIN: uncharacterized protein LOC116923801 [Daphnia magna]
MVNLEIINDLWMQIDKLHLSCLQTEESPQRIEQKRKLKGFMKEYLCLVTSNQRFYSTTTKAVLYTSILRRSEQFSPNRFRHAWEMLATYAANLLSQPWRKEFNEIRLYSGAFKYQIEQQLIGAEEILMEMGYTLDIEYNRLIVQGVLDYDRVIISHRDCLLAEVESQILCEIHAALSVSARPCSWVSIFDFRDSYVGSVNHCVRGLMYQSAQKESHYNFNPPAPTPSYLGPHEMYPSAFPCQMMYQQYVKPAFNYSLSAEQKELYLPKTLPQSNSTNNTARSLEPRSLEGQKMHETFEVWNNSFAREMKSIPKFDSLLDIDRLEQLCYDEVDNISPSSTAIERLKEDRGYKQKEEKNSPSAIRDLSEGNINRTPEKVVISSKMTNSQYSGPSPIGAKPKEAALFSGRPINQNLNSVKLTGWECLFCTFLNPDDREICDMCSKSRHKGSESQPLFRGGRECSNCTLVNVPEAEKCAACSTSLTNAPTYI